MYAGLTIHIRVGMRSSAGTLFTGPIPALTYMSTHQECLALSAMRDGGDPLLWVAVEEGIIDCSDAVPGALNDATRMKAVTEHCEKWGIKSTRTAAKTATKRDKIQRVSNNEKTLTEQVTVQILPYLMRLRGKH